MTDLGFVVIVIIVMALFVLDVLFMPNGRDKFVDDDEEGQSGDRRTNSQD